MLFLAFRCFNAIDLCAYNISLFVYLLHITRSIPIVKAYTQSKALALRGLVQWNVG